MLLGVDFGTSYSQAAAVIEDNPYILLEHQIYGIPSVFCYDGNNEYIGAEALDVCQDVDDLLPVRNVKMSMFEESDFFKIPFSGKEIVQKIYGHILDVADDMLANEHGGRKYNGVVLSVPCKFGDREKRFLTNVVSGLNRSGNRVVGIIKEPVAAAIAYYNRVKDINGNILVFDLGGGTCDIAVVRRKKNSLERFEVIDSDGENIGGRDWDERLYETCRSYFKYETGIDVENDNYLKKCLFDEVVKAKYELSKKNSAFVRLYINGKINKYNISYSEFEEILYLFIFPFI